MNILEISTLQSHFSAIDIPTYHEHLCLIFVDFRNISISNVLHFLENINSSSLSASIVISLANRNISVIFPWILTPLLWSSFFLISYRFFKTLFFKAKLVLGISTYIWFTEEFLPREWGKVKISESHGLYFHGWSYMGGAIYSYRVLVFKMPLCLTSKSRDRLQFDWVCSENAFSDHQEKRSDFRWLRLLFKFPSLNYCNQLCGSPWGVG